MSEFDFECLLNETNEPINLFGNILEAGTLLKNQDPIMFNEMYHDYLEQNDLEYAE